MWHSFRVKARCLLIIFLVIALGAGCGGNVAASGKNAGSGNRTKGRGSGSASNNLRAGAQHNAPTIPTGLNLAQNMLLQKLFGSQQQATTPSSGGGSSSSGSGAYNFASDPTYQAYVQSLDLQQAQAQAETQQRRSYLEANRDWNLGESQRQGAIQQQDIGNQYEGRGLYLSGANQRDQGRAQANQLSREGRITSDTGQQIGDLETTLAQALAQIQLKKQMATLGVFG